VEVIRKPVCVNDKINYWLIRDGLATAENVAEVRVYGATETFVNGRNHNYKRSQDADAE